MKAKHVFFIIAIMSIINTLVCFLVSESYPVEKYGQSWYNIDMTLQEIGCVFLLIGVFSALIGWIIHDNFNK